LSKLPSALDENYEEAMKRIKQSPHRVLAFKALKWIVYAVRPLKLKEVQHAIAIDELEPEDESVEEDCLTSTSTIVNACAGIIRIDKESNVLSLVHKTTQELACRTKEAQGGFNYSLSKRFILLEMGFVVHIIRV
jgi:hypothetical protein